MHALTADPYFIKAELAYRQETYGVGGAHRHPVPAEEPATSVRRVHHRHQGHRALRAVVRRLTLARHP